MGGCNPDQSVRVGSGEIRLFRELEITDLGILQLYDDASL
jgi:hypothetical protein